MSAKSKNKKGKRYSDAEKQEILDFITKHNAEKGRGGQSAAAKKFNIAQLTISRWRKKIDEGKKAVKKSAKRSVSQKQSASAKSGQSSVSSTLEELKNIANEIEQTTSQLTDLIERFQSLKNSL